MFIRKLEQSQSGSYQALDQQLETEEEYARIEAAAGLVRVMSLGTRNDIQNDLAKFAR